MPSTGEQWDPIAKEPLTLDAGHKDNQSQLIRKVSLDWLPFIVLEWTMTAVQGEKAIGCFT